MDRSQGDLRKNLGTEDAVLAIAWSQKGVWHEPPIARSRSLYCGERGLSIGTLSWTSGVYSR